MELIKLLRCMVVSSSQDASEEFAKWLTTSDPVDGFFNHTYDGFEFKVFCRWPNCPKGLPGVPACDALLIRVKNAEDWALVRDYVSERSLIQFKIVVWDAEIPNLVVEANPNIACCQTEKANTDLLEEIIKAEKELDALLRGVFNNFDKSGDGVIDVGEMETMCRELGVDVTHSDFKETLRSLDVNKDNTISFEEFTDWWKNGRQCSKLMESLVSMRLATSTFLNNVQSSKYLDFVKEKVEKINIEKKELVNSFMSINVEKVSISPEVLISFDGYFGGEVKETISKSYLQNFEEGLRSTDYFLIIEFELKDPSKIDLMQKSLTILTNLLRESFRNISRKFFTFINNEVSIKVIKKDDKTICLSFKLRKVIKEQLISLESGIKTFLDDIITQTISLSFCLSGNISKVKDNPNMSFIDSLDPAISLEVKSELLKKNIKLFMKSFKTFKPIPRPLKIWIHSYAGSRIELNFTLDHLKKMNNFLLNQPNAVIVEFVKTTLTGFLKDMLSTFGGFGQFKRFYDAIKENFTIVINTPQIHAISKIETNDITKLLE